jgi:hypothetical protein
MEQSKRSHVAASQDMISSSIKVSGCREVVPVKLRPTRLATQLAIHCLSVMAA